MRREDMEKARVFGDPSARVLLVGEAPNRRMHVEEREGDDALVIPRLLELSGMGEDEYRRIFARTNLLREWPGASETGKGDDFPYAEAREQAKRLLNRDVMGRFDLVVFVGRRSASCFYPEAERIKHAWFVWTSLDLPGTGGVFSGKNRKANVATVPHPSGVSSFWSVPNDVQRASSFWRNLATLARHAAGCCTLRFPEHLVESEHHRFACDDEKEFFVEGLKQRMEFRDEHCSICVGVDTDGRSFDVRIAPGERFDWHASSKTYGCGDVGTFKITGSGKSGAERERLADAFEWIARKLREVPS